MDYIIVQAVIAAVVKFIPFQVLEIDRDIKFSRTARECAISVVIAHHSDISSNHFPGILPDGSRLGWVIEIGDSRVDII